MRLKLPVGLTLLSVVFLIAVPCAQAQLKLDLVFPEAEGSIFDVQFVDNSFGIAVGAHVEDPENIAGIIGITRDGGDTWELSLTPNHAYVGVEINDERDFLVLGSESLDNGLVRRTFDGGTTWEETNFGESLQLRGFARAIEAVYFDDFVIVIGGFFGSILKSYDGGITWERVVSNDVSVIKSIEMQGNTVLANMVLEAAGGFVNNQIFTSQDAGSTWEEQQSTLPDGVGLDRIVYAEDGVLYGFGHEENRFAITRSIDDGRTWTLEYASDDPGRCEGGYIDSQNNIFAAGDNGKILYKLRGKDWREMTTEIEMDYFSVHGAEGYVYFAGRAGMYRLNTATTAVSSSTEHNKHSFSHRQGVIIISTLNPANTYYLRLATVDGRSQEFNISASNPSLDISHLAGGVYTYMLVENGASVLSGTLLR